MGDVLKLDEWEQAQREQRGEGPTVDYGGRTWQLPAVMPWWIVEVEFSVQAEGEPPTRTDRNIRKAAKALLGDQYDDFLDLNPSASVVVQLVDLAHLAYSPKSEGSSEPSEATSGKSKQRTKKRTAAT